jgi:LmbE family N-acetylglucosaminyl deacetylase
MYLKKHNTTMHKTIVILIIGLFCSFNVMGQAPKKQNASEIYHELQKLNFLGSALYIAAHPDDENTRLISYLSNDVKARTAYLSITRGDGGQNLIGPEIRELLGVIRTQELLAARRTDGGTQFFTRANDFGYSKHPDETLRIWNRNEVQGDVVRAIRKFKPDVIINRFDHRTPGSTHGHHTSSAILSYEVFDRLKDDNFYPETAELYGTWSPTRLFFNTSWWFYGSQENFEKADKSNLVEVETGNFYPSLGLSNGEIASLSRSMHKSQGFGSTGTRGSQIEYLEFLKGVFPEDKSNIFDGINTSWSRIEGGSDIGVILYALEEDFNFKDLSKNLPSLLKAYKLIQKLPESHWKSIKSEAIKNIIMGCSGLFLEAVADRQSATMNGNPVITIEAINRSNSKVLLHSVTSPVISFPSTFVPTPLKNNEKHQLLSTEFTFNTNAYSTPYWLDEKGSLGMYRVNDQSLIGLPEVTDHFPVHFQISIDGVSMEIKRNIIYKYNDPVDGEVYRPFEVLPEVTSGLAEKILIFSNGESREVPVSVRSGRDNVYGYVKLTAPEGWSIIPATHQLNIEKKGDSQTLVFTITPPKHQSVGMLKSTVYVGGQEYSRELIEIEYDHIPYQNVLMPAEAKLVRIDLQKKGRTIGYIEGAGDAIPESLKQIGYEVNTIEPDELGTTNLDHFDAIVIGIRAYNTIPELAFKNKDLHDYVANGGTLVVQYNTRHRLVTDELAPYPITLSKDRVTDEDSQVIFLDPGHRVLNYPNKITQDDFKDWVQERGLYFPSEWSDEYQPILGMMDPGNPQTNGSLLVTQYGKGYYIYTGLSFFRELPAGVPGAYRLFANLLSIGK